MAEASADTEPMPATSSKAAKPQRPPSQAWNISQGADVQDAVRDGGALLQRTAAAGKAANSCLGGMGSEEAAPQGQLLEKLLRESEELQGQLVNGLPAGQVRGSETYC